MSTVAIGGVPFGGDAPLAVIAGPCAIESPQLCVDVAGALKQSCAAAGLGYVFKASFDKANRTSAATGRGLGLDAGLAALAEVKAKCAVPVVTDVHLPEQAPVAADVCDALQIPSFLCRQTDLVAAAAATGRPLHIKKGQFLSPDEMVHVARKAKDSGASGVLVCERGTTFGYNNLVVDMRSLHLMRRTGCPVVFDATHSVQLPGAADGESGGERELAPVLARAACAVGVAGLFFEAHPEPDSAISDAASQLDLGQARATIAAAARLSALTRELS